MSAANPVQVSATDRQPNPIRRTTLLKKRRFKVFLLHSIELACAEGSACCEVTFGEATAADLTPPHRCWFRSFRKPIQSDTGARSASSAITARPFRARRRGRNASEQNAHFPCKQDDFRNCPAVVSFDSMTKHIFVTGGVVSSLGKRLTSASIGMLLEQRGLRVRMQKLDPYINVDPGTMSPYQHGEVYVLDDGSETDLDLG